MTMNIKHIKYLFAAMVLVACSADDADWQLSPEQQSLIGQRVDFSTSMADPFITRATTNHHDGSFNDGDQMRIFRQYAKEDDNTGTVFDAAGEIFRTYYLKMNYAAGTSVSLESDWIPKDGKLKSDKKGETATQEAYDSLKWENGCIVRFRAWGRSNLVGHLDAGTKASYYPDYTVSDWVTVSGPTKSIPLTMRHIACRVGFTSKSGNELSSASICLDWHDYMREDNADTSINDQIESGKSEDKAKEECNQVVAAYNKMCMPAGVDDETFLLTAMTTALLNGETTDFKNLEKYAESDGIVKFNTKDADYINKSVQRPVFNSNDGRLYFVTIPIDMSTGGAGKNLVLPACTRFKVCLRGDGGDEKYHIFALSDIKNGTEPMFPDGLTLKAGYSYLFNVGYHYNSLTITPADSFSWASQDAIEDDANNAAQPGENNLDKDWFTSTLNNAVKKMIDDNSSNIDINLNIDNATRFVTFLKLASGTANSGLKSITRGELRMDETDKEKIVTDAYGVRTYYWTIEGENDENGDPKKFTSDQARALGYIFYPHFYPSVSTDKAYAEEECLTGAFDFKDINVSLGVDLDLYDWSLPSAGPDSKHPFRGRFYGNGYTLKNLNMADGYLFNYVEDGVITNLKIESTHSTCLLNSAKASSTTAGWGSYIAGISMLCPSATNSIATSLDGNSYVVGCIHVGKHVGATGGALVGSANTLTMMGCMQAAEGIPSGSGALVGASVGTWGTFKYNFYDVELSPGTNAVGDPAEDYDYDDYIRGSKSHILKAVNNYEVSKETYAKLNDDMKLEVYGIAPWTAMNSGIEKYNQSTIGAKYPCNMRYETSTGYSNRYPSLNKQNKQ